MNYENLKDAIVAVIKQNGNEEITGNILQQVLVAMVNSLGSGYQFRGIATPETNPGTPDQRVFYLASATGTYSDFGFIVSDEICALVYDTAWHKQTIIALDQEPTEDSGNLISSGAIYTALQNLADVFMELVEDADEDHIATFDENGQVKDSGLSLDDIAKAKGSFPELFAGFAGNLVDTRSAGTHQGPFAFRQSGGDRVNYMRKILGKTEAFNQLFDKSLLYASQTYRGVTAAGNIDTGAITFSGTATGNEQFNLTAASQVKMVVGHKYLLRGATADTPYLRLADQTAVFDTGNGMIWTCNRDNTAVILSCAIVSGRTYSGTIYVKIVDLTLMYGAGNEPATVAEFEALHPLGYYSPASKLINNAATGLETTGFNQWDEEWMLGGYLTTTGKYNAWTDRICSKNPIAVLPNTQYYSKATNATIFLYDAEMNFLGTSSGTSTSFSTPSNCHYIHLTYYGATTYNHDICINLSDASRNGTYEPYWERDIVLGLDNLACHDENNNAVVVNGLDGVGTAQDEAVVENGMVTKIIKKFKEIDLGDFNWTYDNGIMNTDAVINDVYVHGANSLPNAVCANFIAGRYNSLANKEFAIGDNGANIKRIYVMDSAYTDAATFKAAVTGVKLRYELATPKVLTLDNPIPALIEVDNLGTEKRLPEDTADNPQAPFECDSNYSISTANLVRKLSEL